MSDTEISGNPRVALLGVPVEIGASQAGTLMGPAALRTAGIARVLEQLGLDVDDHGDLSIHGDPSADGPRPANAKYYDEVKTWVRSLSGAPACWRAPAPFRYSWVAITASRWDR